MEALANYFQWYDLSAQSPKLIISQFICVVPISGDFLILTEKKRRKVSVLGMSLLSSGGCAPLLFTYYFQVVGGQHKIQTFFLNLITQCVILIFVSPPYLSLNLGVLRLLYQGYDTLSIFSVNSCL